MAGLFAKKGGDISARRRLLDELRARFASFQRLLENNHSVLRHIADLEEKARGEYLFDINYVRSHLAEIRNGTEAILEEMISLGGESYAPLRERFREIDGNLERLLPGRRGVVEDAFAIPLGEIGNDRLSSVGGKSAQLGEMKRLGLPVPDGFAISGWAYKRFLDANNLQGRIHDQLAGLDLREYAELVRVSESIRMMVRTSPVPEEVASAIHGELDALMRRTGARRVALRSSAVGEDTLFSFAGQYTSYLNLPPARVIDRYRDVIAGKFTPKAIYYFLSHSLEEEDLAMAVGCLAMVDPAASGVVYTRDPVRPDSGEVLIHAVLGLGKPLVDGTLTPDAFAVSREDGRLLRSEPAVKRARWVLAPGGGILEEPVGEEERARPAVDEKMLKRLADYAVRLEEHYGSPQDIEWAVTREGELFLLQTRPLQVIHAAEEPREIDLSGLEPLAAGGTTVCPGVGYGVVAQVASAEDLAAVPEGAVVIAPRPFPGLVTVMQRASALVTEVGGVASHMATLAREYRIPTLAGVERAGKLPAGRYVTVDATGGAVYPGKQEELLATGGATGEDLFEDTPIFQLLNALLRRISPLNLLNPSDEKAFTIERCETMHDLTRFCHQKAIEELFHGMKSVQGIEQISYRLKSEIPLPLHLIFLDPEVPLPKGGRWITEEELVGDPIRAFWEGVRSERWPKRPRLEDLVGLESARAARKKLAAGGGFSEVSYAFVGSEYLLLSLRMGYHFTTVEAICSGEANENYIRFEHKGGGASLERRIRRVRLLERLLTPLGFEPKSTGDFLDLMLAYEQREVVLDRLRILGRISMMTKQLDMALSSDELLDWYLQDIRARLGLADDRGNAR